MQGFRRTPFYQDQMSVRPVMAASNFPPFHRPSWPPQYIPHQHHFRARQFQPPPSRTMAMMQASHTTASGQLHVPSPLHHNEPSFFEDSLQHDATSIGGDLGSFQQWPDPQCFNIHNFRPAESVDTSFTGGFGSTHAPSDNGADDTFPRKVDNSPTLPALSYKVDTSKYENVDYKDYIMTSMGYEGSSPSSIETESTGPPTPTSPGMGSAPFRSYHNDPFLVPRPGSSVAKVETAPLQSRPDVVLNNNPSLVFPPSHVPLSLIFNEAPSSTPPGPFTFAHHPHAHGGLINSMTPYQGFMVPTIQPAAATDSFSWSSISSVPELDQGFLDTTSEEDSDSENEHSQELEAADRAVSEASHRRDRDKYLLKMRERGMSYREIKRIGRFTEAESTLRGRVRVMTKHKSERVRKPVWTDNDVRLLEDAIEIFVDDDSARDNHGRIPWKKISDWMKENGSSYFFAGATCARKWKSLN